MNSVLISYVKNRRAKNELLARRLKVHLPPAQIHNQWAQDDIHHSRIAVLTRIIPLPYDLISALRRFPLVFIFHALYGLAVGIVELLRIGIQDYM